MTFSDVVAILGASAGLLVLLAVAAAPLLADLPPRPRQRGPVTGPAPVFVPAPRAPADAAPDLPRIHPASIGAPVPASGSGEAGPRP